MKELTIIKIGGKVIDDPMVLEEFLLKFSKIPSPKILIHGGGTAASKMAEEMGIETKMNKGRRITDFRTLKLVTMLYAGWINKSIVADLIKTGCNALGLSGADCDIIPATKRCAEPIDYGYVGDVDSKKIDNVMIKNFLARGICPVFCAITHDENGTLLNTNADTMASNIAIAMKNDYYTRLVFCFEKEGVLLDQNKPESIVPLITKKMFKEMSDDGKIEGGMIPKLENAFFAAEEGVSEVYIKNAANLDNDIQTLIK